MEELEPVKAFEALAHETRLAVFILLIPAGREGLPAGAVGARLGLPANSLSFHLARLANAGLIRRRRHGRHNYYAVEYERLSALAGFLVGDCCGAVPEGCMPECPGVPGTSAAGVKPSALSAGRRRQKGEDHAHS